MNEETVTGLWAATWTEKHISEQILFSFKYKDFQIKRILETHTYKEKKQNSNYTLEVSASWGLGCWQSLGASGWHSDPEFSCWPAVLHGPAESLQLPPGKQKEDSQSWYLYFCLRRAIRRLQAYAVKMIRALLEKQTKHGVDRRQKLIPCFSPSCYQRWWSLWRVKKTTTATNLEQRDNSSGFSPQCLYIRSSLFTNKSYINNIKYYCEAAPVLLSFVCKRRKMRPNWK